MSIGTSLRQLGDLLDEWDGDAVTIESVRVSDEIDLAAGENFSAAVSLSIDLFASGGDHPVVVETTPSVTSEDTLALDMETSLPVSAGEKYDVEVDPYEATLQSDGSVAVEAELVLATPGDRETGGESRAEADATSQETEDGNAKSRDPATDRGERSPDTSTDGGNRDVPPFKDTALLREVYENHDTFAEMADAIEMDVTGETVRRYMIDCDIHEPNSYRTDSTADTTAHEATDVESGDATDVESGDTSEAAAGEPADVEEPEPLVVEDGEPSDTPSTDDTVPSTTEPVLSQAVSAGQSAAGIASVEGGEKTLVSDGIGIPDSVEIDELIETVNRSRTIHEVSRDLDFDRSETRELLTELNLLDLVLGRINSDPNRTISREDVIDRLRAVSHPEP